MSVAAIRIVANAAKMKTKIELYYDVISPFSWYAFEVLHRYKPFWNIDLHLKPVLLAGIIKSIGTTPEMLKPTNPQYRCDDIKRCAKYFGVPLKLSDDVIASLVGGGTLTANRFLTAIDQLHPHLLENASRELWMAVWNKHEDISSGEVLASAGLAAGLSPEEVAAVKEQMSQPAAKERLRAYTDEAVEHGAFGVPTILTHSGAKPQLFFGSDRFHLIAREINETWVGPQPNAINTKL